MGLSAGMRQAIGIARNMRKERFGHDAAMQEQREATTMRGQDFEQARHGDTHALDQDTHALARDRLGHDTQSHGDMMGYRDRSLGQADRHYGMGLKQDAMLTREQIAQNVEVHRGNMANEAKRIAIEQANFLQPGSYPVTDSETGEKHYRERPTIKFDSSGNPIENKSGDPLGRWSEGNENQDPAGGSSTKQVGQKTPGDSSSSSRPINLPTNLMNTPVGRAYEDLQNVMKVGRAVRNKLTVDQNAVEQTEADRRRRQELTQRFGGR